MRVDGDDVPVIADHLMLISINCNVESSDLVGSHAYLNDRYAVYDLWLG